MSSFDRSLILPHYRLLLLHLNLLAHVPAPQTLLSAEANLIGEFLQWTYMPKAY